MFQSFVVSSSPEQGPPRLAALRERMTAEGIDAFIVPRSDAHQGEYIAPCDARLPWLTGFTGSAGFAVVTQKEAGVFVDGRYRTQLRAQVDLDHFTPVHWPETKLHDWVRERLGDGAMLAYDPWLHTVEQIDKLEEALEGTGIEVAYWVNMIDEIWPDRPPRPREPVSIFPDEIAGATAAEKCARIAKDLRDAGQTACVLTLPDSICWLLNIRGQDIPRNPVVHAFAILHDDARVDLFTDAPLSEDVRAHLGPAVTQHGYDELLDFTETLTGVIRIDPASLPVKVFANLAAMNAMAPGAPEMARDDDPCILPKALKTAAEIAATRNAHLRDGTAMVEFLSWLDREAPGGGVSEIDAAKALEGFRRATNALRDISFDTISGAGPNGAIVHYRVTEETNRPLKRNELYLVDSGGQYLDGTTDITRTVVIGQPTAAQKDCFTRVLKGMIAISQARFPRGVAGRDLDALARAPLWQAGYDFDHGTGHGVGVYLSVHEGPQRLSRLSTVPLQPGMILSNEPGYYRDGEFGIRIENLIVVQEAEKIGDRRDQLSFETLTYVPIDLRLIDISLLSPGERDWLNAYHRDVGDLISPRVSASVRDWLEQATRPI